MTWLVISLLVWLPGWWHLCISSIWSFSSINEIMILFMYLINQWHYAPLVYTCEWLLLKYAVLAVYFLRFLLTYYNVPKSVVFKCCNLCWVHVICYLLLFLTCSVMNQILMFQNFEFGSDLFVYALVSFVQWSSWRCHSYWFCWSCKKTGCGYLTPSSCESSHLSSNYWCTWSGLQKY